MTGRNPTIGQAQQSSINCVSLSQCSLKISFPCVVGVSRENLASMITYTIRFRHSLHNRFVKYESIERKCHLVDKDIYIVPGASQRQLLRRKRILSEYALTDLLDGVISTVAKDAQDWGQVYRECVRKVLLGDSCHSNMIASFNDQRLAGVPPQ